MVKGAQSFNRTRFCVMVRFERMLCTVITGAMPSEVDKNIIPQINFLIVDETVEHLFDVVTRQRQGITRGDLQS